MGTGTASSTHALTRRAARPCASLLTLVFAGSVGLTFAGEAVAPDGAPRDLTDLSLAELASVKVVSVQKRPEALKETPAAVSVISSEEIQGASATSIPALLRRVPGVHVAQLDASQWAIGIRGFTNSVARSQLALMDGRSLYTPLFAGTYWDVQNAILEDLDRIEVVRGPGGTLWGANAVNGIVNIVTKSASDTAGGLVVLGGGNEERGFGRARFGGRWGEKGTFRVYGMYFDRAAVYHRDGDGYDAWHMFQGGFRTDWALSSSETLTVQGDVYSGRAGRKNTFATFDPPYVETLEQDAELSGGNLRTRWARSFSEGREVTVQVYYDRTNRHEPNFSEDRDTVDLDAQYRFALPGRQELVAGVGYRVSDGRTTSVPTVAFVPPAKTDDLFSAFLEDTIELVPNRLRLTLGSKVERNDYSGFEFQPGARMSFTVSPRHSFWLAVTRPVRTPTRFDRDLVLNITAAPGVPVFVRLLGDDAFETERSLVYEAGYRTELSRRVSFDVAGFYNRYPNFQSFEAGTPFRESNRLILPLSAANGTDGKVGGVEVSADVRPLDRWLLRPGYAYLNMQISPQLSSKDTGSSATEDASPRHQVFLSSRTGFPKGVTLDASYRWVARLPSQDVPAYSELDLRAGWRAFDHVEFALAGQNLLHAHHEEFGAGAIGGGGAGEVQIRRSVFGQATLRW
jgi:iron complex outermembrane recepter protein